jgi:PhnB protein
VTNFKPEGWPDIIPRIFTHDVGGLVHFIRSVFGANGGMRIDAPAEMKIGDSMIMVSDGGGVREARPAYLYVYVKDADKTFHRAINAGAVTIEEPTDTPYDDRRATVQDPWGNI